MSDNQSGITYRPESAGSEWLRSSVGALRSSWIVVLACVVVGGLLGLVLTTQQAPAYESSAVIYQTPRITDSESTSIQRTEAYTELLTSDRLIARALEDSGIQMSVKEVREATTAAANAGSAILTVTVRTDNADTSADLANALAEALPPIVGTLDGEPSATPPAGEADADTTRLSVITPATPDAEGGGRNYGRNIALGIVAGLLVGVLSTYLRSRMSRRLQDAGALSTFLAGPVLASIPADKALKESGLVDFSAGGGGAEAFRRLRTAITGKTSNQGGARTIVVTSATDGDGKTTTAINLAVALAEVGFDVVFVDAVPSSGGGTGADTPVGLSDYLQSGGDIGEYPSVSWQSRLWIIPSGTVSGNPSELLASNRMRAGLAELAARSDYVIVDSTSLDTRSDAIVLGREGDGVLVVARSGQTRYDDLRAGIERLSLAEVPVLGVVLNGYPRVLSPAGRDRKRARLAVGALLSGKPRSDDPADSFLTTGGEGRRRREQ